MKKKKIKQKLFLKKLVNSSGLIGKTIIFKGKRYRLTKKFIWSAAIAIIFFIGAPLSDAFLFFWKNETTRIYPDTAIGDWQEKHKAIGRPEVADDGGLGLFSPENSASYRGDFLSLKFNNFTVTDDEMENAAEELQRKNKDLDKSDDALVITQGKDGKVIEIEPEVEVDSRLEEIIKQDETDETFETESVGEDDISGEDELLPNEVNDELTIEEVNEGEGDEVSQPQDLEVESENPEDEGLESDSSVPAKETQESGDGSPQSYFQKIIQTGTVFAKSEAKLTDLQKKEFKSATVQMSLAIGEQDSDLFISSRNHTRPQKISRKLSKFFSGWKLPSARAQEASNDFFANNNLDTILIIWYSMDGEDWQPLELVGGFPKSNKINNGYYSFDVPFLAGWEDLSKLRIRLEGMVGNVTSYSVYLDSLWVEVEHGKKDILEPLGKKNYVEYNDQDSYVLTNYLDKNESGIIFKKGDEKVNVSRGQFKEMRNPSTDGNHIVWEEEVNGRWQIFAATVPDGKLNEIFDLSNLDFEVKQITDENYANLEPVVSEGKIVWQAWTNDSWNIMMHDPESGKTEAITDSPNPSMFPSIRGNNVAYQKKDPNGNWQIYYVDVSSQSDRTPILITDGDINNEAPAVTDTSVFWRQGVGTDAKIVSLSIEKIKNVITD